MVNAVGREHDDPGYGSERFGFQQWFIALLQSANQDLSEWSAQEDELQSRGQQQTSFELLTAPASLV
jgi:hypothetical protein